MYCILQNVVSFSPAPCETMLWVELQHGVLGVLSDRGMGLATIGAGYWIRASGEASHGSSDGLRLVGSG